MLGGVSGGSLAHASPGEAVNREAGDRLIVCPVRIVNPHAQAIPRTIGPGDTLQVESGDSATLVGPYPGPRINLAPGRIQLLACTGRVGHRPGSDLAVLIESGVYRMDLRPGDSSINVSVLGRRLTAIGAQFMLEVAPDERRIVVTSGTVQLDAPFNRAVGAGETCRW